ncbi:MAG: polysaccharide deacetylase family protein [Cellvibrionaceae bacterium]
MKLLLKSAYHVARAFFALFTLRIQSHGSLIVLTYHRVLPDQHPAKEIEQPGMVISPRCLDKHISLLKNLAHPIAIDDWATQRQQGTLNKKCYFAITFDDGWQDNFTYALPILEKHQVPNTIFLVTKMIGTDANFWPNRLGQLIASILKINPSLFSDTAFVNLCGMIDAKAPLAMSIDHAINNAKKLSDTEIHEFLDEFYSQHTGLKEVTERALLNFNEIETLNQKAGTTFGSHTQSHCRLHSSLEAKRLHAEIIDSKQDLETITPYQSSSFCYPNGDISKAAEKLIQQYYNSACTTAQGINPPNCDPFKLKRFNLHNGNSDSSIRLLSTLLGKSESVYY